MFILVFVCHQGIGVGNADIYIREMGDDFLAEMLVNETGTRELCLVLAVKHLVESALMMIIAMARRIILRTNLFFFFNLYFY